MKVKIITLAIPAFFFSITLFGYFYLTDFSVYWVQRQWVETSLVAHIKNHISNQNIYLGYSYAIAGAFASICILNLITASGGIKQSIQGVTVSVALWAGICFISGCCGSPMLAIYISLFGSKIAGFTKPITAGITTVSILLSFYYVLRFKNKNLIYNSADRGTFNVENNPFATIKTYKPAFIVWEYLRFLLMTIFRLFPNPAPLGLYKFGNPGKNSPVLVTSNYVLTLARVARGLKDLDCYLLVVDGKGINVWCAAGAGHFTVASIINGIKLSPLEDLVTHRNLILPQFCATGICRDELKEKTGWLPRFGPTYSKDIHEYLRNNYKKTQAMRSANFRLGQRIEMGIGASLICVFVVTCIMVFVNVKVLYILIPIIYFQAILFSLVEPYLPRWPGIIIGFLYGLLCSSILFILAVIFNISFTGFFWSISIPLFFSAFYLANEFLGWSPLIKYNWQLILKGSWKVQIAVDPNKCIGCGLCVNVCPTNVFSLNNKKSTVINITDCEGCKACYYQCPVNAIQHSLQSEKDSCACVYCNIQEKTT